MVVMELAKARCNGGGGGGIVEVLAVVEWWWWWRWCGGKVEMMRCSGDNGRVRVMIVSFSFSVFKCNFKNFFFSFDEILVMKHAVWPSKW